MPEGIRITTVGRHEALIGRLPMTGEELPFLLGDIDHFQVIEKAGRAEIVPGLMTTVFGYNGIAPGPTIKIMKGRAAVLRVRNHLPALNPLGGTEFTTAVHLHGSASLPQFDGYASDVTPPGCIRGRRRVSKR